MARPLTDPRADSLRQAYNQLFDGAEIPVPVEAIAEDLLGLAVGEADLGDVSGLLYSAERRILLNAAEGEARRRFTLAHEIGHWVCQCLEGKIAPFYCRIVDVTLQPDARAFEREANVFAAELLMPEDAVRLAWASSIAGCAEGFRVSGEAMHWRLYNLGLVEDQPHPQEAASK